MLGKINVSYPIIIGVKPIHPKTLEVVSYISSVRNRQSGPFSFMYVPEERSPKLSAASEIITSAKNFREQRKPSEKYGTG